MTLVLFCMLLVAFVACKQSATEEGAAPRAQPAAPELPVAEALYDCTVKIARGDEEAEGKASSTTSLDEACALALRSACTNATTEAAEAAVCVSEQGGWKVTSRVRDKRIRQ